MPIVPEDTAVKEEANVPMVRVNLLHSVHLLPHQSQVVDVAVETDVALQNPFLLEFPATKQSVEIDPSLIQPPVDGITRIVVSNPAGISCHLEKGCVLGEGSDAALVDPVGLEEDPPGDGVFTWLIQSQLTVDQRRRRLEAVVGETGSLNQEQRRLLMSLLATHHTAFCLEEHERGETNLVEMEILTGDAEPKKQPVCRMPLAVRQEVAYQLKLMQKAQVIQPSSSPWASPVVMVRKKDEVIVSASTTDG